jgi:NTP pyrophosphatase (non-canonical NTP hydrolase)
MELHELTTRAIEIRASFGELAQAQGQREWKKEDVMQGFVVDVGDLMRLVMAKSGLRPVADLDRKLAHELSDCLWSILVLAHLYGINLEAEFHKTMNDIEAAIAPKGTGQTPI